VGRRPRRRARQRDGRGSTSLRRARPLARQRRGRGRRARALLAVGADGAARLFAPAENGRLTGFFDGDLPAMRPSAAVKAVGNAVPPALARAEAAAADRAGWYDGDGSGAVGGGEMADS
jgi:site-specific DNA-cytosine methylase